MRLAMLRRGIPGNLGSINLAGRSIPIQLRQSDRARAIELAKRLKMLILEGLSG